MLRWSYRSQCCHSAMQNSLNVHGIHNYRLWLLHWALGTSDHPTYILFRAEKLWPLLLRTGASWVNEQTLLKQSWATENERTKILTPFQARLLNNPGRIEFPKETIRPVIQTTILKFVVSHIAFQNSSRHLHSHTLKWQKCVHAKLVGKAKAHSWTEIFRSAILL